MCTTYFNMKHVSILSANCTNVFHAFSVQRATVFLALTNYWSLLKA